MSIETVHIIPAELAQAGAPALEQLPDLGLGGDVSEATSKSGGTYALEEYFAARSEAAKVEKPDGEELAGIQETVREWLTTDGLPEDWQKPSFEQYAGHDMESVWAKFSGLMDFLRTKVPAVSEKELGATELFLSSTEIAYNETPKDGSVHPDADGSFAFVVPARMSRNNPEYGQEVELVMPALRYVPRDLRSAMMLGLPPFVIDRYKSNAEGRSGVLVFAPVYPDMEEDLGRRVDQLKAGRAQVNAAVDFAYGRFGTEVVGLGAILPSLTLFGQKIENQNVITTTGHGGTIQLIFEALDLALREGRVTEEQARKLGILGLGAIGEPIAHVGRHRYPDASMTVYDPKDNGAHAEKVAEKIGARAAQNEREVFEESGVVISALSKVIPIRPQAFGLSRKEMAGMLLLDDSQPGAFDPEAVVELGATLAWIVGRDGDSIVRSSYTYGDTLASPNDLFGCEAEAAVIAAYRDELLQEGISKEIVNGFIRRIAIRKAVTPEMVDVVGWLFQKYGVSAAPLQAFGKYV